MKHLKLFETNSQYESYKNGDDFILPNVSYCTETKSVSYNPYIAPVSPNIVLTFNVTDISEETFVLYDYAFSYCTSMIVDGVETELDSYYQFDTPGLHTVEYIADDRSCSEDGMTFLCKEVISEGLLRLYGSSCVKMEFPASIKYIDASSSIVGESVSEIIFHSTIEPEFMSNADLFIIAETGVLKYPKGSDYSNIINCMATYHPGWTCVEF